MKKSIVVLLLFFHFLISCSVQSPEKIVKESEVERIIKSLSSDDMQGRKIFSPGIEKAAKFIENEFSAIGLQPLKGSSSFRQTFTLNRVTPATYDIKINGKTVQKENVLILSDKASIEWTDKHPVEVQYIKAGDSFTARYQDIVKETKPTLIYVDSQFFSAFKRFREHFMRNRLVEDFKESALVFVMGDEERVETFNISFTNKIDQPSLANIVGVIPGRSKANEVVIFSAHYDHIGVLTAVEADSIANGADDNASGVTAVIQLAKYFKKLNNNERTLIFAAFTAEEVGGLGSQYFSKQQDADDVVAMFNIEMIGKESKFGKNAAFITGFDKSDFGQILQKNLEGTPFKFYADPYPEQDLFYRSDNATLAALGVPAHTISTDRIDSDKFYHSVDDELSTLNLDNITATIKAIAISAKSIVEGKDQPRRIRPISEAK